MFELVVLFYFGPFILLALIIFYPPLALIINSFLIYYLITNINQRRVSMKENEIKENWDGTLTWLIGFFLIEIYLFYKVFNTIKN